LLSGIGWGAAAMTLIAADLAPAAAADFYQGKTLTYIGSPGAVNSVLYVRSGTGIKTFEDMKSSARQLTFGALGSTPATAMVPALRPTGAWRAGNDG
jgi:hypothetical protein